MRVHALRVTAWMIAAMVCLPMASAQDSPSGPERILFDSANRARAAQNLPPLRWDSALAGAARRHAEVMAQQNAISHQFPGEPDFSRRASDAGALFSAIAENVAVGQDAEEIHGAWMKSPPHRGNLLDPEMNSLGVAVAGWNGRLFAVADFSRALIAVSLEEQEKRVSARLRALGLHVLQDGDAARRACAQGSGYQSGSRPRYLLRYTTTTLDSIPSALQQKIRTERYHEAAVGACPSHNEKGFANYQVAVILFEDSK